MSRIGRMPVTLPAGVECEFEGRQLTVKGPRGCLGLAVHSAISLELADGSIRLSRSTDRPADRSLHGLTRSLVANLVTGVTLGFFKELIIRGIGYKAQLQGRMLILNLGHSHPIEYAIPEHINIEVTGQTRIKVSGIDKQLVGQVAAEIKGFRPVEPYKGKGIRYAGEHVRKKEGKTAT